MKLGSPTKVLRLTAQGRVSLQFPFRFDQRRPASVMLNRGDSYDLDLYDIVEIDGGVNALIANGTLVATNIGFVYPADVLSYDQGGGSLVDIQTILAQLIAGGGGGGGSNGGRGTFVTADHSLTLAPDQVYCAATVAGVVVTLPALASVLVTAAGVTTTVPFNVKNSSGAPVTIAASAPDLIEGGPSISAHFRDQAFTLLPTPTGWVII